MADPHIHIHTRAQRGDLQQRLQQLATYDPLAELTKPPIYTYTHTQPAPAPGSGKPEPQARAGEARETNNNTHKNIHIREREPTNDSPMSPEPEEIPRPARYSQGKEAEERLAEILQVFGRVQLGVGTNGEPDLLLETQRASYAVEAKSMRPMKRSKQTSVNGYKVNDVTLALAAWLDLSEYAAEHELERLLAVELRIRGAKKGHLYHVVKGEIVDQLIKEGSSWISCNMYDLAALSAVSLRPGLPIAGGADL